MLYRAVSKAVMAHRGQALRWSRPKNAVLARAIDAVYLYERLGGWRRLVTLRMPAGLALAGLAPVALAADGFGPAVAGAAG